MTEKEMIQKIYEAIKLVDCLQYNPSVDFNYLRAKGVYNIIKNQVEHIEAENTEHRAEVAERALSFLCGKTMNDISVMVFPSTKTQVQNKQELYDYCIKQAAREIEEEE